VPGTDGPQLAAAKRLLDAAKDAGFTFARIAPGPDGPLRGTRQTREWDGRNLHWRVHRLLCRAAAVPLVTAGAQTGSWWPRASTGTPSRCCIPWSPTGPPELKRGQDTGPMTCCSLLITP
jgi:hypothetical protein